MTFILGIKCPNGIVLCADRMEDDGYSVRQRPKLESYNVSDEWGVCWGGSGKADPVDKFSSLFRAALGNGSFNKNSIEKKADNCLKSIKNNYSDYIKVVVGVFGKRLIKSKKAQPRLGHLEQMLYRGDSDSCCLSAEREWCCAGLDTTLTKFLMAASYHSLMEISEAQELGIWVTALMKIYASGVGGPTDVVFKSQQFDVWLNMSPTYVSKIETRLSAADTVLQVRHYWGDWHSGLWSDTRTTKNWRTFQNKLRRSASRKSKGRQ